MATTPNPNAVAAISRSLTRLRLLVGTDGSLSAEDRDEQHDLMVRALADEFDARDVSQACAEWAKTSQWWPKLHELRLACVEAQRRREERKALASPATHRSRGWAIVGEHDAAALSRIGVSNWLRWVEQFDAGRMDEDEFRARLRGEQVAA